MSEQIVFLDRDTTDRGDLDLSALESLGRVVYHGTTLPSEAASRIAEASIILTNKVVIGPAEMDAAPQLKLIQAVATGVNNLDLDAARERCIAVCNVSGYSTEGVAQHVFAFLLNLQTNMHRFVIEAAQWPTSPIFTRLDYPISELVGKTMGIVGLGATGHAVARIAKAFGMRVIAYQREGSTATGDVERLPPEAFFGEADVVSLHCPLTPETTHFINQESLALMKRDAILINTGRGDLVDEVALVTALRDGTIGAAAVDVVTPEPPPADHPFISAKLDNLLITPHIAWGGLESRQRLIDGIVANIEAFRSGEERNRVV